MQLLRAGEVHPTFLTSNQLNGLILDSLRMDCYWILLHYTVATGLYSGVKNAACLSGESGIESLLKEKTVVLIIEEQENI